MMTRPLQTTVATEIEEDIELGHYPPQARLREEELAKRFSVGRHVIRAALQELYASGLVDIVPGKGASVKYISPSMARDIYSVRVVLEHSAFEGIKAPIPEEVIADLWSRQREHEEAILAVDLRRASRTNIDFHNALHMLSGNAYLAETIEHVMRQSCGIRAFTLHEEKNRCEIVEEHRLLVAAAADGNIQRLKQIHEPHTLRGLHAYLEAHDRVSRLREDERRLGLA